MTLSTSPGGRRLTETRTAAAPVSPASLAALQERRARREQRRTMERARNVLRAKDMHSARLTYEPGAMKPLAHAGGAGSRDANARYASVGCSGWYYRHWADEFYPPELRGSRWFAHYADNFQTVELNSPFYNWPSLATVATWRRQVRQRDFSYTIKVSELITHTKRFLRTDALVKDFCFIADLLGSHFGCFLFQLPPSFKYSSAALQRILRQLDPRHRNVVEFRHSSWWDERVFKAFRDSGTIFCSINAPRLPDALIKTADEIYVRFHGPRTWYRHDYSEQELAVWTDRIGKSGATRVWAYFNNDRDGYAIDNARELRRQLAALPPHRGINTAR